MKSLFFTLAFSSLFSVSAFAKSRFCGSGQYLLTNDSSVVVVSETVTGHTKPPFSFCTGTVVTHQPYSCSGGGAHGTLIVTHYNQIVDCPKESYLDLESISRNQVPDMYSTYSTRDEQSCSNI